jgi:hypothetical protein
MRRSRALSIGFLALPPLLVLAIWMLPRERQPARDPLAATDATSPDRALPDPDFHVYLLMGQSNMVGVGEPTARERTAHPRIRSMDEQNQWRPARDPLHPPRGDLIFGVGPGMTFARAMLQARDGGRVGLVPCAQVVSRLARWQRGGHLYDKAVARAHRHAQRRARGRPVAAGGVRVQFGG